jgi:hypothetical protein
LQVEQNWGLLRYIWEDFPEYDFRR